MKKEMFILETNYHFMCNTQFIVNFPNTNLHTAKPIPNSDVSEMFYFEEKYFWTMCPYSVPNKTIVFTSAACFHLASKDCFCPAIRVLIPVVSLVHFGDKVSLYGKITSVTDH